MTRYHFIYRVFCLLAVMAACLQAPAQSDPPPTDESELDYLKMAERIQEMHDELRQLHTSLQMLPAPGMEARIKSLTATAIAERLGKADRYLKSLDFRWTTYYQTIQPVIADDEELMKQANTFQQLNQAVRDTLNTLTVKVALLQAFCRAETFIPTQATTYDSLYRQAVALSAVAKLAPRLEKLKVQETLLFANIDQHYNKAREAVAAMPALSKRMASVDQQYIELKTTSGKIQAAKFVPIFDRIKNYLLGLAAVALLLMFVTMVSSRIQAIKQTRANMKKMKEMMNSEGNFYPTIALIPLLALLLTACQDLVPISTLTGQPTDSINNIQLSQPRFSDQWKTMVIDANLSGPAPQLNLTDSQQVRIEVSESINHLLLSLTTAPPTLVKVENAGTQQTREQGIKLLTLVDLTLPQEAIDQELLAVSEMRSLFSDDNIFVAFIKGTTVTETMPLTDYVLSHYFMPTDTITTKYLYRAILDKMDEVSHNATWTAGARHIAMIVLSDGVTYKDQMPMDPKHFEMEQQLTNRSKDFPFYFARFDTPQDDGQDPTDGQDLDFLMQLETHDSDSPSILEAYCQASRGLYQPQFDWAAIRQNIQQVFGFTFVDYRFVLENPDNKVYRGFLGRQLQISCYDAETDSLMLRGTCRYSLGKPYSAIIVNPSPLHVVLVRGIILVLVILLLAYALMQLLIPYIRYRRFLKKHVVTYTGKLMGARGALIGETCYLCKGSFNVGDQVVTKCQHSMHLDCWEENGYQCPEYGRHCQHGRHYYNRHQLLDPANASVYCRWIIVGILAGLAAWIDTTSYEYGSTIQYITSFSFSIGFFLTLMLSCLSVPRSGWYHRVASIALRTVAAALGSELTFLLSQELTAALGIQDNSILIDWIPWLAMSYCIAFCVTFRTRIKLPHWLIIASAFIGLITTHIRMWFYSGFTLDYRLALLCNILLYTVLMAASIARTVPRSERYFLITDGIMKHMDIALYKWFMANPNDHVTIGNSVDCHLQLSWDIKSKIAPKQAEIVLQRGVLWLYAIEEGVTVGKKALAPGKRARLFHGRSFSIGETTFTYIEKDK